MTAPAAAPFYDTVTQKVVARADMDPSAPLGRYFEIVDSGEEGLYVDLFALDLQTMRCMAHAYAERDSWAVSEKAYWEGVGKHLAAVAPGVPLTSLTLLKRAFPPSAYAALAAAAQNGDGANKGPEAPKEGNTEQ